MARQLKVFFGGSAKLDYSRDASGKYYNQLLNTFEKYNLVISTLEEADLFVSVNHSSQAYRKFQRLGKNKSIAVLIRSEPFAVFPAQYSKRVLNKYGLVITLGHKEKDIGNFYYLENPYTYLPNPNRQMTEGLNVSNILISKEFDEQFEFKNWEKRQILMSLIASNKVSCVLESNYDLRRSLAYALSKNFLEIYGELWNANARSKLKHRMGVALHGVINLTPLNLKSIYGSFFKRYKNYVGVVEDKHLIVKQSKFSLVIENSNEYMSEKFFDAIINGSIPIYYGPEFDKMGIPGEEIAIRHNESAEMLEKKITNLTNNEIKNYLSSMKDFLNSKDFKDRWNSDVVYKKIACKIREHHRPLNQI